MKFSIAEHTNNNNDFCEASERFRKGIWRAIGLNGTKLPPRGASLSSFDRHRLSSRVGLSPPPVSDESLEGGDTRVSAVRKVLFD